MNINKKGSYIVEATICLPFMVIAMVVMHSLIMYYATIENSSYILAVELRKGAIERNIFDSAPVVPVSVTRRIRESNANVKSAYTIEYTSSGNLDGIDQIISMDIRLRMHSPNPIGIAANARYNLSCATRAYVGRKRDISNMTLEEFMSNGDELVCIFPKDGERFHKKSCTFVKATPDAVVLDGSVKRKYNACPICNSGNKNIGDIVYVFSQYGESYHDYKCSSVTRKYIEVERDTAISRGYTPCSKCGG